MLFWIQKGHKIQKFSMVWNYSDKPSTGLLQLRIVKPLVFISFVVIVCISEWPLVSNWPPLPPLLFLSFDLRCPLSPSSFTSCLHGGSCSFTSHFLQSRSTIPKAWPDWLLRLISCTATSFLQLAPSTHPSPLFLSAWKLLSTPRSTVFLSGWPHFNRPKMSTFCNPWRRT